MYGNNYRVVALIDVKTPSFRLGGRILRLRVAIFQRSPARRAAFFLAILESLTPEVRSVLWRLSSRCYCRRSLSFLP